MNQDAAGQIDTLLNRGDVFEAYEAAREALIDDPRSQPLRERLARALIRAGAETEALDLLAALLEEGHASGEVLGLEASTRKSRALASADPDVRRDGLARALDRYEQARTAFPEDYWFGVNVATLAFVLGEPERARECARALLPQLASHLADDAWKRRGWALGTEGEARLVLGDEEGAIEAYGRFRDLTAANAAWEMRASALRNARLLLHAEPPLARVEVDAARIEALLQTPPVAIGAGHMIDAPGRVAERFPATLRPAARVVIEEFVARHGVSQGYACLARGTDTLFHEVLSERGVRRFAMVPYRAEAFVADSVADHEDASWVDRFQALWRGADNRCTASRYRFAWDSLCYEFANEVLTGLALLEAEALGTEVVGFALWDGKAGDGQGGAESIVRLWRDRAAPIDVELISPEDLAAGRLQAQPCIDARTPPDSQPPDSEPLDPQSLDPQRAEVMALLFADARGFGKLDEVGNEVFATQFLTLLAKVIQRHDEHIFERNTWGDAVFLAMTDVEAAGHLALDLCSTIVAARPELIAAGLPPELDLRVALHAAPVRVLFDPIRDQPRVSGAQISEAARIEPITPPGHVYASQSFAALSRAREATGFSCRYVGQTELAKNYGREPLYIVEQRT